MATLMRLKLFVVQWCCEITSYDIGGWTERRRRTLTSGHETDGWTKDREGGRVVGWVY